MEQESANSIAVRLRDGWSGVRIPTRAKDLPFLQNAAVQPAPYSMGTGVLFRGAGGGVKLTTLIHPGPRLRISGNLNLLPLYTFIARTGTVFYYINSLTTLSVLQIT
jgi:hypothetical protein